MEDRERCLMDQPIAVLQAYAQECGVSVAGCLDTRDLVLRILDAEPTVLARGQALASGAPTARSAQSEADLAADEELARRLQADEDRASAGHSASALGELRRRSGGGEGLEGGSDGQQIFPAGLAPALLSLSRRATAAAQADAQGSLRGSVARGETDSTGARRLNRLGAAAETTGQQHAEAAAAAQALERLIGQAGRSGTRDRGGQPADGLLEAMVEAVARDDSPGLHEALATLFGRLAPQQGIDTEAVSARTITTRVSDVQPTENLASEHQQCMVCLEGFQSGQEVRILPCLHRYHIHCIDPWLGLNRHCPVCKHDVTR